MGPVFKSEPRLSYENGKGSAEANTCS